MNVSENNIQHEEERTEKSTKNNAVTTENDDGSERPSLIELTEMLSVKLNSFESEGLSDILDKLAEYEHNGESLKGLADKIRDLTEEFDFIGASEVFDSWKGDM